MAQSDIIAPSADLKSLPTIGINTTPTLWRQQKAHRDMSLANETNPHYWICQNKLYNLTDFIALHPGGPRWLINTRNHDITQLFITHHLNQAKARAVLEKYYVRECVRRIERFRFDEDGLYRVVKRRVLEQCEVGEIRSEEQSVRQAWVIITTFTLLVTLAAYLHSYTFSILSGLLLMGLFGVMHNFLHHKQNPYSSLVKFTGFSFDDFQLMHCISHHVYVNTELDFEATGMEPIAYWMRSKPENRWYTQLAIQPIMAMASVMNILMNLTVFPIKYRMMPQWDYAYPLLLLGYMYVVNGEFMLSVRLWLVMYVFYSFFFFKVLLCEHRMPELWTQGNERIWDFGQHTVASTSDVNPSVTGIASFIFLAGFNLHTIHHFFPTADHSILPKLNKILVQVCNQRKVKYHSMGRLDCAIRFSKGITYRQPYQKKKQQ